MRFDRHDLPLARRALGEALAAVAAQVLAHESGMGCNGVRVRMEFDSAALARPGTLRGNNPRRHCVYRLFADGDGEQELSLEVMVERQHLRDVWTVVGQVLHPGNGKAWSGGEVRLSHHGQRATLDLTTESGEFWFTRTDCGPWELHLRDATRDWGAVNVLMP